ncbi:MAG: LPS assembly lipoprotein LptE [Elusimicrobia bacterium]|nr:LPS assembly lipoprotein LptE [Elusimicrobiota bacterium]
MRKLWIVLVAAAAAAAGCGQEVRYNPTPQILPQNIKRLALRPILNKTGQYGLEDKLLLRTRDEFLRDGRYPLVPEPQADGLVYITITRYLNTPVQYDSRLIPTAYKLRILIELSFVDKRKSDQALWIEKNMEGILVYTAPTLAGGMTEEQAREQVWDVLARDIVTRVVDGFGTVTGTSQRTIQGDAPSTEPVAKPQAPLSPVTNPY